MTLFRHYFAPLSQNRPNREKLGVSDAVARAIMTPRNVTRGAARFALEGSLYPGGEVLS
jgi:hypothetical protein